jgi:hypothetical protein
LSQPPLGGGVGSGFQNELETTAMKYQIAFLTVILAVLVAVMT